MHSRMRKPIISAAVVTCFGASLLAGYPTSAASCLTPAAAASAPTWPTVPEAGAFDVAHFGEAHWNEGQGPKTVPILVQEIAAHSPDFVAFSSDMADVGEYDRLACFRSIMEPLGVYGVPWFDSPGNHDRKTIAGTPGGVLSDVISPWRETFAGAPAPWGDGPAAGPGFVLPTGEDADGVGASTHYYFDYGPVGHPAMRFIVLDNSRHSFTLSDVDQYPPVGPLFKDLTQLAYYDRVATDARDRGLLTFVMFHEPTQDPRDQTMAYPISYNHSMAKGATADNALFDALAQKNETDVVLTGHILGNFRYQLGDTEYFIDGGAGGTPYSRGETGTDSGYFYAFRLLRVYPSGSGWSYRTYTVPLVDHLEITAPSTAAAGSTISLSATAVQPHDPSLLPRFPLQPGAQIRVELRPPVATPIQGASVPVVAYMWSTSDASVLRPVGVPAPDIAGDPSFDAATMTTTGTFKAVAPGTATITISTGTHSRSVVITVT